MKFRSAAAAERQQEIYYKDFFENKFPPVWITLNQLYWTAFSKVLEEAKKEARKELNEGEWPSLAEGNSDNSRMTPTPAQENPIETVKNC